MKKIFLLSLFLFIPFHAFSQDLVTEAEALNFFKAHPEKIKDSKLFKDLLREELLKEVQKIKDTSVVDLTNEVIQKEALLEEKREKLTKKENQLKNSEAEFAKRITDFEKKQKLILGCEIQNEQKTNQRVGKMVSIISKMKVDKAAELFSAQDSDISVKLLSSLDPEKASKIFNKMDKETSARLQKQYLNMKK